MTQEEMKNDWLIAVSEIIEAINKLGSDENTGERLSVVKSRSKRLLKDASNVLDVEEPEFKVGDYVSVVTDGTKKITKISDRDKKTHRTHGLWYDESKNIVKQDFWYLGRSSGANATPEEIAEYEVALNFHKRGRKPFEVKEGDIIGDDLGNKIYIIIPDDFDKEDFTSGEYTLLKTAEEVNEWLGADNE